MISKLNPRKNLVVQVPRELPIPAVASTEFVIIRPTAIDARFLFYLLSSEGTCQWLDSNVRSVTRSHQRVEPEFITHLRLDLPSEHMQRRIADFLDDQVARIDNIIAARRTQMTLIDADVESEIDATFGAAPLSSVTRLGRFLVRIEQGWSPQCDAIPADDDEWGVLKVSAVKRGHFDPDENKRLPDDLQAAPAYEVRENDLLVTRANTPSLVGMFAVVPPGTRRRLIMSDKIMRLSLDDSLDPRFVAYSGRTMSARAQLTGAGTGTSQSMVNIRGDDIRDLRIRALALADQKALVSAAQASEAHFRAAKTQLTVQASRFEELKRSLITAAVTGEFDVSSADGSRAAV